MIPLYTETACITCCLNSTYDLHEKWGDYHPSSSQNPNDVNTSTTKSPLSGLSIAYLVNGGTFKR
ncbi:Uncharacterised protein [Budvicia aquatica]|uniref:Uncharacterized protein n=1 Tax=Budvicia aquatica TaxID=82979 RepID=A0A484ZWC0_9GAMM|nr:Uncharacterised protein [Budvicia aquatica]